MSHFDLQYDRTPELDQFWVDMRGAGPLDHELPGFHYRHVSEDGQIKAAIILQPFGQFHIGHICSTYRNKKLIKFCEQSLETFKQEPTIGFIVENTRNQRPDVDKLVIALGFKPIETEFGTEYYWPSKQLTLY